VRPCAAVISGVIERINEGSTFRKEACMGKGHVCQERDGFELMMVSYPHGVWRCDICGAVMSTVPLDDLEQGEFTLALEMILRFRRARRGS
jgi:hypothetical protein